jgi:endogenous inhibitor of DNA gyrase (YacG/DUF329 family)
MGDAPLCVLCGKRPVEPKWRPFCSERCRTEDLARWAEGRYRVPGPAVPSPDDDQDQDHDQDHNQDP